MRKHWKKWPGDSHETWPYRLGGLTSDGLRLFHASACGAQCKWSKDRILLRDRKAAEIPLVICIGDRGRVLLCGIWKVADIKAPPFERKDVKKKTMYFYKVSAVNAHFPLKASAMESSIW